MLFIIEDERSYIDTQNGFEIDSVRHTKKESVYNACRVHQNGTTFKTLNHGTKKQNRFRHCN
jgi:hypothetical protein